MTDTETRTPEQIAAHYAEPQEPANEPILVRRNRHGGWTKGNVELMSRKAGWLAVSYTKHELTQRLARGDLVAGYSAEEMLKIATWLSN